MKKACRVAGALIVASLLLQGCSRSADAPVVPAADQASDPEIPAIERYRMVLATVKASQQALALETAKFTSDNWSGVVNRSLEVADELHASIEQLKTFDEVAPAAAALQGEVGRLQRELRSMDASTWQDVLPDLLLATESIQSGMDELEDLAAPEPDEMIDHDPDHDHARDLPGA